MNTQPTCEIILQAADRLEETAKELRLQSKRLEESGDFSYTAEVANKIVNMILNLRLDLLITRPIREYEREKNS